MEINMNEAAIGSKKKGERQSNLTSTITYRWEFRDFILLLIIENKKIYIFTMEKRERKFK